jgi:hypothetical protein
MSRLPAALAAAALVIAVPSVRAQSAAEIGLDAGALRIEGDTETMARLRGSFNLFESLDLEAQALRTLGSGGTWTSVMVGPSLRMPIGGSRSRTDWTLTGLVGGGRAEALGLSDDGLTWQLGTGLRWRLGGGVNVRLEGGWTGIDLEESGDGPFLATGVAWRLGD